MAGDLLDCLKPRSSPTFPPGFGTGHSRLLLFPSWSTRSSWVMLLNCTTPPWTSWLCCCTLRLRLLLPFSSSTISPSAYVILGAGHGSTCGRATTKKLASMVVANKDEVIRDLGWRCGGMMARVVESRVLCKPISLIQKVENHQLCLHRTTSVVVMACGLKSKDREAATAFGADQCVHQKIAREAQMTAISLDSFRQAKCWRATQRGTGGGHH